MEAPRPWAGPGGETIANGHRGNPAGCGGADYLAIGGLVAQQLLLKALRSSTHVPRVLAVKISILAGKSTRTNFLPPSLFSMRVLGCRTTHKHTSMYRKCRKVCSHMKQENTYTQKASVGLQWHNNGAETNYYYVDSINEARH